MKPSISAGYQTDYSPEKLWQKLKTLSGHTLTVVALKAIMLYELLKEEGIPITVKAAIIATLGYLICPVDVIPDVFPGGYVDDITLMIGLLARIDNLISPEVKERAGERLSDLKGVIGNEKTKSDKNEQKGTNT